MERSHGRAEPPGFSTLSSVISHVSVICLVSLSQYRTWRKEGVTMTNQYETAEVVEMGKAKNVILGRKMGLDMDPETAEYTYDLLTDESDE
jgi:hypothetical protein